jgi:PII-like signaling protein
MRLSSSPPRNRSWPATVLRGILAYGANSIIHRAQLLEISSDLPIVIEIVDETEKIRHFVEKVKELFDRAGSGGLITLEKVEVIVYKASEGE